MSFLRITVPLLIALALIRIFSDETNEILIKQCSDLNEIIGKCLEISSQVKDRDKAFTPFCTLHQICNICVSR